MGCKSNQFEGEIIKDNLAKNGFTLVENVNEANFFILNSCSVTHKSDNEAFYLLRSAKNKNPQIKTVLTGCVAQIEKEKLLDNDFIDYVVGNNEKLNLSRYLGNDTKIFVSDVLNQQKFSEVEIAHINKTRASLKIQDGCDNRCSYCIIWKARGKSRSASLDFIINQINKLSKNGYKEVILTGIHIGQWGKDIGKSFLELVTAIENHTTIERYRLGSLNPSEINDELLYFLQGSSKFCPHFHLSLQSANDKTLKSMNRFYTTDFYLNQIDQITKIFTNPFIGCDIIAGFAGETDEDFDITIKNLAKSKLTQIHTFPYSIRKGTVGEQMPYQVPDEIKIQRANIIKNISKKKYHKFIQDNINTTQEALIEIKRDKKSKNLKAITRNYLTIQIVSPREDLYNTIQKIRITDYKNDKIFGEII